MAILPVFWSMEMGLRKGDAVYLRKILGYDVIFKIRLIKDLAEKVIVVTTVVRNDHSIEAMFERTYTVQSEDENIPYSNMGQEMTDDEVVKNMAAIVRNYLED